MKDVLHGEGTCGTTRRHLRCFLVRVVGIFHATLEYTFDKSLHTLCPSHTCKFRRQGWTTPSPREQSQSSTKKNGRIHVETGAHTSLKPISIELTDISTHSSQRVENVGDSQLSELSIQLTYSRNAFRKSANLCGRLCRNADEERLDNNMFHEYKAKKRSEPNAQSIKHTTTAPTSVAQPEEKELRHTKGKRSQAQHRSSVNLHGSRRARRCATLCTLQKKTDATLLETLYLGFLASDIQSFLHRAQKKLRRQTLVEKTCNERMSTRQTETVGVILFLRNSCAAQRRVPSLYSSTVSWCTSSFF